MTGYYDLVLGLIPVTLAGISGALVLAGLALTVAIPIAGAVTIALIGHALFVRSPTTTSRPTEATADSPGFNSAD